MFVDMPLAQLREYRPERSEPAGFDAFWERTLKEARGHALAPAFTELGDTHLASVRVHDASFAGFGGHRIGGWLLVPAGAAEPLPCVVQYIGYGGGRGLPHDWLLWPAAGYATFVMDTRGQGAGGWSGGGTPDPTPGSGPETPGKLTRGALDPDEYYYRRLYTDAVRAVEAARSHPAVDGGRIVVTGGSQGGGIALAAAALADGVRAAMIDVPFMTHVRHAVEITDDEPYGELSRFFRSQPHLVDTVLDTIDHVDGLNMAARATVPALFSVALRDPITPASTVFAAYNHYAGPKDIRVWPYNGHEGGGAHQKTEQLRWLAELPLS
ncbi:acetylxylan esterase [Allostreptomyces psammosilenae]|uniref:Cephalosporin-C deacetylase n=1 Tax=Allostreptomyces psammosilenae TaxID=1892865 RepID=A0A852ZUC6_9ACTN|nr:acetylxylan esterase [Allostreptomyces psammosilenae]NYI04890.1 cephalosporin-C deacetylase [Allostreptomyces psammosilenae]